MKYKISELAKILDVSTNTVRRYETQGYITSVRDENSGYRYYTEEDVVSFINARLLRKYGFSHEQLEQMKNYDLCETITAYEDRMAEMDKKIAYMTYVRHRIKDDVLLLKKVEKMDEYQVYEKDNVTMVCVLYKENDKILTEPGRLKKISEFMYSSPEVQRIYIIRKSDIDNGRLVLNMGWSIKEIHMDKYGMTENQYTERYEQAPSIMGVVKLPVEDMANCHMSPDQIKNILLGEHLRYMKEHGLEIAGDVLGVVIGCAYEQGKDVQYLLMSVPVK